MEEKPPLNKSKCSLKYDWLQVLDGCFSCIYCLSFPTASSERNADDLSVGKSIKKRKERNLLRRLLKHNKNRHHNISGEKYEKAKDTNKIWQTAQTECMALTSWHIPQIEDLVTSALSSVKTEPDIKYVTQDSYIPNNDLHIKEEQNLSVITQDNLLFFNRNNNYDLASVKVENKYFNNGAISQHTLVSHQGSPKRIKIEIQRPTSPILFDSIDYIKDEQN